MATLTWTGNAAAVRQRDTITVANTWTAADTATLTINGKDLVVTIGADTTTAQVAQAIRDAWNANTRLDSEGTTDATSSFGGQEFGEFAEATASIDPDATSVVIITANTPGKPFVLSVTEATAGDGTATAATAQAATGPYFWDNGDNWDSGTAPANDDIVVFRDTDVSVKYGLPNGAKEVTIQQYQSFTGSIGLPAVNRDNAGKPYQEYRQRYVRLNDAGGGSAISHAFGIGVSGTGSPLINVKQSTIPATAIVYNTGTPQIPGTKALNICSTATTSTINILNGSVDFSSQDGSTSAWVSATQTGGDACCIQGIHTTGALVTLNGGKLLIGGTGAINTVRVRSGQLRIEGQTGTISTMDLNGNGTTEYASTATITTLGISGGATFDARTNAGVFAAGTTSVYAGRFIDPYRRVTISTAFNVYYEPSADLQFGASVGSYIQIVKP